jgi:hypothetical protein
MIFGPGKNFYFSTYASPTLIHLSHRFTSASEQQSFYCCLSLLRVRSGIICYFWTSLTEFLDPVVNRFTRQTLPNENRKHFFIDISYIESLCPQRANAQAWSPFWLLKLASKHAHAHLLPILPWLCCYLVIHIENALLPLQLFHFHLFPIQWLSLVTM